MIALPHWLARFLSFFVSPTALFTFAWLILVLAAIAVSPLLAAISAILLVGGCLAVVCRRLGCTFPTGSWLLLWLVIPPPVGLDQRLVTRLQLISSQLASKALDLLGVNHLMSGNALVLPTKELFVDEACSGIVSVISLTACAAIYGVWRRRPAIHTFTLIAAGLLWAVLFNVVRIVSIALAEVHWQLNLAEGLQHTLLGLGIFALNLVALIVSDWLLHALLSEIGPRWTSASELPLERGAWLVALWDRLTLVHEQGEEDQPTRLSRVNQLPLPGLSRVGVLVMTAFAAVGMAQLALPNQAAAAGIAAAKLPTEQIVAALLEPGVMPDEMGEMRLVDVRHERRERDNPFGEESVIWEYQADGGSQCLVSCDMPYAGGWHELSLCYMGIGWQLDQRTILELGGPEKRGTQLDLTKGDGSHALVMFCCCLPNGQTLMPPKYWGTLRLMRQVFFRRNELRTQSEFYQVQVVMHPQGDIKASQYDLSLKLLRHSTLKIAAAIASAN